MVKHSTKKHKKVRSFAKKRVVLILLGGVIIGVIGAYLQFSSKAQYYTDPSTIYGLDAQYTDQGENQPYQVGEDFLLTVVANPPASWIWGGSIPAQAHINLEIYHDGPLEYRPGAFSCGTAGSCTSGPPFPGNGPGFVVDDRRCVNLTSASLRASQINLMTIGYKMKTGGSYAYQFREGSFEVRAHADWEPGPCNNSNDWVNCYFVSSSMCGPNHRAGWPLAAYGGGSLPGGDTGENSNLGDGGGGGDGSGEGDAPGDNPADGAGGGSSSNGGANTAKRQANQSNIIPSSSSQGARDAPSELEPSPFFDGKEYQPGSDTDTFSGVVSKTGTKLLNNWYLVLGALLLGGTIGYSIWKWHKGLLHFRGK